jgi:enoyl-CoA hydratase/carnithine racemase
MIVRRRDRGVGSGRRGSATAAQPTLTLASVSVETRELETIRYEKDAAIARIVLNTPQKANVQTAQQVWDMEECLRWAEDDESVKVLVLKAEGKGFCAGHAIVDREEMASVYPTTGPTSERTWKKHNYDLFLWPPLHLWEFPKATIAQVHGYCLGGGTVYGYLTDLTVASEDAYFQMPLPQGFGLPGAQTMIEPWVMMNWKKAAEYLYLAPTLSAAEAMEWGLVNKVVPRDELESTVEAMAAQIALMPLTTIMTVKLGIKRAWEQMGMRLHLQQTTDTLTIATGASDVQAFMMARAGRRPRQHAADRAAEAAEAAEAVEAPEAAGS